MNRPNLVNEIFIEISQGWFMKSAMKAPNIPNEIFNKSAQH